MSEVDRLLRDAVGHHQAGRLAEAQALYARVLIMQPAHPEALHLSGLAAYRERRHDEAIHLIRRAIEQAPGRALYHGNLGNVCKDAGRDDEAIESYTHALSLDPSYVAARNNLGVVLRQRGRRDEALIEFERVIAQQPDHFRAHFNLGDTLHERGELEAALASYRVALKLQPDFVDALAHAGLAFQALGRNDAALPLLQRRAKLTPDDPAAHADVALALHRTGDLVAARVAYSRALDLAPESTEVVCNYCALLQRLCDWELLARWLPRVFDAIRAGRPGVPLGLLVSQPEFTPALQLAAARANALALEGRPSLHRASGAAARERIRVGYLSGDFREHATAWLTAELFELHDRRRFDVVLISHGPDDRGAMRARLAAAADSFIDVAGETDQAAAQRIADEGIDILVDLNGNTDNGRMGIMAWRPAPIQVNWLGFPGTLGAGCYDYLVADAVVIPPGAEHDYAEAIVRLPDCYQCNDRRRVRPAASAGRAAYGLPDDAIVLCCFNQSFKLTPAVWSLWLRVLAGAHGAVLWLLDDNPSATAALRQRAKNAGIATERIVFAPHTGHADHLARYLEADLAVDTFPCASHTTASDALWMGCPLVTLSGTTFASRVAASLLHAVGMPGNVCQSARSYEARLVELAADRSSCTQLRQELLVSRDGSPLFDTPRFRSHFEQALTTMVRRRTDGKAPDTFAVG